MQTEIKLFGLLAFMIGAGLSAPALAQWQLIGNRDANTLSFIGTINARSCF